MTTELTLPQPATPVQHLDLAPNAADQELLNRVASASNTRVGFTRQSNGRPQLRARTDAGIEHLRAAHHVIVSAMESGPQSRVSAALTRLAIVCHRPKRIATEEAEMLWFDTMTTAMMDYPLDVVQWAFEEWRKSPEGNWWPAEAELRILCERAVEDRRIMLSEVESALRDMQAKSIAIPAPRKYEGRAAEFMSRARKRCTKGQVLGYFSKWTMRIEGDAIWVRGKIHEIRVREIAGDIADDLGLAIKWDSKPGTVWPFYDGPEPTDGERAEFIARLHRLSKALAMPRPTGRMTPDEWARQLRAMADHASDERKGDA